MKFCIKCKTTRLKSDFHKDKPRKDGLSPYCRFCRTKSGKRMSRQYRKSNPQGYILIYEPKHELAQSGGYVYEHRYKVYEKYGENIPCCELCGKTTSWEPYKTHIDHIDRNVANNNIENLRVLCNACNSGRDKKPFHTNKHCKAIIYKGTTLTPEEWSRKHFVSVKGRTISRRINDGWSIEAALNTPSKTIKRMRLDT